MSDQCPSATGHGIVRAASLLLRESVLSCESLHGGELSEVLRIRLGSGEDVVAKSGPHPDREARMLNRLAETGACVPLPVTSNAEVLVMEDIGPATSPTNLSWQALGTKLRAVHAEHGDLYGWDDDYAFGEVQICNEWRDTWSDFWIENHLLANAGDLPNDIADKLQKVRSNIQEILPCRPAVSLLHGDLWSGNVHFTTDRGACLIDPASYYAHAEVDLAMLTLFGAPPKAFWTAYGPLDDGWEVRRHAYQL